MPWRDHARNRHACADRLGELSTPAHDELGGDDVGAHGVVGQRETSIDPGKVRSSIASRARP